MQAPGTMDAREARDAVDAVGAPAAVESDRTTETTERVLAGWAHDLGKPLQVIWDHGRRLAEQPGADARTRETALAIVALSNDALGVIDRLTVPDGAAAPRRAHAVELASALVRAAEISSRLHPDHEIRILEPIPRVELDFGDALVAVLVNLVENAVQASPADRPVTLGVQRCGDEMAIEVRDRGTGMSESVRARAFDTYFSTRRHPRGGARGLGLAAVRERVDAMGGRIELDSAPARGTRAKIWLPARRASPSSW